MSSVERGVRNISVLNLARIAAALSVPLSELVGAGPLERPVLPRRAKEFKPMIAPHGQAEWQAGCSLSLS